MRTKFVRWSLVSLAALVALANLAGCSSRPQSIGRYNEFAVSSKEYTPREPAARRSEYQAPTESRREYSPSPRVAAVPPVISTTPKAHGGNRNVNNAPADAMFFRNYGVNPALDTADEHFSTFGLDVDTASYSLCRSYLERGQLPPKDAVRVEEFVNYFDYGDQPPRGHEAFAVRLEAAPSHFTPEKTLIRIGVKARDLSGEDSPRAILTFVIDCSGSMAREDRLELVKKSLRLLVDHLRPGDKIGLAIFGTNGRELLDHLSVENREQILEAIDSLRPDGSTNAAEGLRIGYQMAAKAFRKGAINRVILCSDGVANTGLTSSEAILRTIRDQVAAGITLSTVGVGMGNYNDVLLEQLADQGSGNYAYVDTLDEARRIFVRHLTGTLELAARDAKVQVDFNPEVVRSFRLVGYENRDIANEDFRKDRGNGGAVGSGRAVTALYEVRLQGGRTGRLATVTVRYKNPDGFWGHEISRDLDRSQVAGDFSQASPSFQLAACVAEFAEILRQSYWARGHNLSDVLALARQCRGDGEDSRRRKTQDEDDDRPVARGHTGPSRDLDELVRLIERAGELGADRRTTARSSVEE